MHYSTVNLFAFAAGAMAQGYGASNVSYTTVFVTDLTTVCPGPTSFVAGGIEYTITEATTLTITDCSCTHVIPMSEYTPGPAYVQPTPAPYVSVPAPVASSPAYIPAPAPYVPAPAPYVPVGTGSYTAASPTAASPTAASPTAASPAFTGAATINAASLSIAGLAGVAVLALAL